MNASMLSACLKPPQHKRSLHPCVGIIRLHRLIMDSNDCPDVRGLNCYTKLTSSSSTGDIVIGSIDSLNTENGDVALSNTPAPDTYLGTSNGNEISSIQQLAFPQSLSMPTFETSSEPASASASGLLDNNAPGPIIGASNSVQSQNNNNLLGFYSGTIPVTGVSDANAGTSLNNLFYTS